MTRKTKPFTLRGDNFAAVTAARAEDAIKAGAIDPCRLSALETVATFQEAKSKEAALFHVGLLCQVGDRLSRACAPEVRAALQAQHDRLTQSLARYLEGVTGVDRHKCGFDYYLGAA